MSLALVWSDRFLDHAPPAGHPESVGRGRVMQEVTAAWRSGGGTVLAPGPASRIQIERIHAAGYVDRLAASAGHPAALDLDTYMSPGSWDAAVLAAGAAIVAVERAMSADAEDGGAAAAFAMVRPPGHHALRDRAMGFCLLDNAAIAVAHLLESGLGRVAVVDYDVHHGNGTQWAFYDDPRVLVISLHQHPFYPHTGAAGECGIRRGEGFTVNIPIAAGATDGDYLLLVERVVEPILDAFGPELLVIDAGFDAHDRDPLAQMHVSTAGFARIAVRLLASAARLCRGRIALVTEGGYDLGALRESLEATIAVLAAGPTADPGGGVDPPTRCGLSALELVCATQVRYWSTL